MSASLGAWPRAVFQAPLLRGLDERGRAELERAGKLLELVAGETLFRGGERGEALFVVADGELSLRGQPRGEDREVELRTAQPGDSCGEEASIGASWRATATANTSTTVAEIPVAMLRRVLRRAGGGDMADRIERRIRRRAAAELLRTLAFTRELGERDMELLLDGIEHRSLERGEAVYRSGERARAMWLVADGMVQLQTQDDERLRVRAYLTRGDFFGDEEVLAGAQRRETAVASGAVLLLGVPAALTRTLADRNPGLLPRLRRVASAQADRQHEVVHDAALSETQHAFRDLYRLQVARSLLVIDLDQCVRCGHCAWSCEALHGTARLVRRGDKIVTRVSQDEAVTPLLLPNSCQHCENPACMPDCPTGAIGRDPRGEVYIRDALCTGCGACAKGCPWDNIQMVARPADAARPAAAAADGSDFAQLAVKCDLCREYEGPACVQACPTEAIMRINPSEDLPEVQALLGALPSPGAQGAQQMAERRAPRWPLLLGVALMAAALAAYGLVMHSRGAWVPWRGPGWLMGPLALAGFVGLFGYAFVKRLPRMWSRRRGRSLRQAAPRARVRSRVAPQMVAHVALGLLSAAAVLAHGGARSWSSGGGAAAAAFLTSSLLGVVAFLTYGFVPQRLSRLERKAMLPEDYAHERRELLDQVYGGITGRSELVKRLYQRLLLPYLRRPLGWVLLFLSGRRVREERQRLRAHVDGVLEGRGAERLAGLDQLIALVVALRALAAQRALTGLLRLWLPLHLGVAAVAAVLLAFHLAEVLLR